MYLQAVTVMRHTFRGPMQKVFFNIIMGAFCLLIISGTVQAAVLTGKTAVNGAAAQGVQVLAYQADVLTFSDPPFARSTPTAADGLFSLDLPPGNYYLLASGSGWFSYYGRNPLTVTADGLTEINLPLVPSLSPAPDFPVSTESGIAGQIVHNGKPVPGAVVFVYPDLSSQFKGFGLGMSAPSNEEGFFEVPLPAGRYYLVARVRHGGSLAGPLQAGDLFGFLPVNPVNVEADQVAKVVLPVIAVPEKISLHAATMFGTTRISGRIVDKTGKPRAGLQALLYEDDAMLNRPLYVSSQTGPDGVFHLSFPSGGDFYLAARNTLGGTPAPGDLYGRYQGGAGAALHIETGKSMDNLQIVVEEVW